MNGIEKIWLELVERYPALGGCRGEIMEAYHEMRKSFEQGGKLLICGNGGSSADAQHIVGELMKEFKLRRKVSREFAQACQRLYPGEGLEHGLQGALPASAIGVTPALSSAYANDASPEMAYAQEVFGYGRRGDVLLGLSTSGNSQNVINAVKVARAAGLRSIGLGGQEGGRLRELSDVYVALPERETYLVQELTLPVYHAWCRMLEWAFWGDDTQLVKRYD